MAQIIEQLKLRNVRKTLTIYLSSALTTVGVIKLLQEVYNIPSFLFPATVTMLIFGIGNALIYAWYHGLEGEQKVRKSEIVLHTLFLGIGLLLAVRSAESPRRPEIAFTEKSIAVLPFKNLGESKEDEYFSLGITDDILTQLSKIKDIRVISRTSVMKYVDSEKSIREIADELGVSTILEGSVQRIGNRVRITSQLIDARTDGHVWAEKYDREMKDIFSIQSDVAQRISAALQAQLQPEEKQLIEKKATENIDAYAYYLRGRDYYYRLTKDDNERAAEFFKKAIALDSTYALAFTGLADAYAQRVQRYDFPAEWADSSIALSKHAIELDADLAEAYKSLGLAYYQREWYSRAIEQYRKALELNPNYASAYANMGELMLWTGHQDETIRLVKKAVVLSPGRASFYSMLGNAYAELEMDSSSLYWFEKAIELQPTLMQLYVGLGELYTARGEIAKAREVLRSALEREPDIPLLLTTAGTIELYDKKYDAAEAFFRKAHNNIEDNMGAMTPLAFTLTKTGKKQEAEQLFDRAQAEAENSIAAQSEEGMQRYELARIAAIRNKPAEAIRWLHEAIELGARSYRLTVHDPLLENLWQVPEFVQMMEELHQQNLTLKERVMEAER